MGALLVALYHIESPAGQIYLASRVLPSDPAVWFIALLFVGVLMAASVLLFMMVVAIVCVLSACSSCLGYIADGRLGSKKAVVVVRPRIRGGGRSVHWADMQGKSC